ICAVHGKESLMNVCDMRVLVADKVVIFQAVYGFFFSSRRRHTRSKRDWSSDVCSSDLSRKLSNGRLTGGGGARISPSGSGAPFRSEERRVGKEGSARWGTEH